MNVFWAELIGTAILVILGNGVVANVLLTRTKGNNAGWIVITAGWGMAVFVAILCVEQFSGAHLNPAVTLALASAKKWNNQLTGWNAVPVYLGAQMLGGIIGGMIAWRRRGESVVIACSCLRRRTRDRFRTYVNEARIVGGHPVATAVGLKNLEVMEREDVLGNVRRNAPYFQEMLDKLEVPVAAEPAALRA